MANGNRKVQYLITCSISVATVVVGCFISWPTPVIPKFHNNETNLYATEAEVAWMVAMSSPGFMAGSLATRFISDSFGRRVSILSAILPVTIGTIIAVSAKRPWLLYLSRFLWGSSTGVISTVSGFYLAELADKEIRGRLSLVTRNMVQFGNIIMMFIGPFVSYETLNYMLLVLPVLSFAACWWIPESPYYCLKEGKVDEARKVLALIRRYEDDHALEDDLQELQADVKKDMMDSNSVRELFSKKKYRKAVIITAGLRSTQILSGIMIVQEFLGVILYESLTDLQLPIAFIIFATLRFLVGLVSSVLSDKVGRLPLLIYSYFGTGIIFIIVGIFFFLLEIIRVDVESIKPYSLIPFIGITLATALSSLGYQSVIVVITAETFPMNVKAIAITAASLLGGSMNFFMTRGYQMIKDSTGLCGVFWFFGTATILGGVFSVLYVPETKGKTLKEIQMELQGDLYDVSEMKRLRVIETSDHIKDTNKVESNLINTKVE